MIRTSASCRAAAAAGLAAALLLTSACSTGSDDAPSGNPPPIAIPELDDYPSAQLIGQLALRDGCLVAGGSVLLLPEGTQWFPEERELVVADRSAKVGDQVRFGGGEVPLYFVKDLAGAEQRDAAQACLDADAASTLFLVSGASDPGDSAPQDADLDLAVSEPQPDSVYPDVGQAGVDALHYDLDLNWDPDTRVLTGRAEITLRATRDADALRLDLAKPLKVADVTLDGQQVTATHPGNDLVIPTPVRANQRYALAIDYRGRARALPAPTERGDFDSLGWTVTPAGEVWTMQEPYGAHSWYPVNDHPSDKALYSFTIHAPRPWTGVANGRLVDTRDDEDGRTTRWETDEPLAAYLATVAIGDYTSSTVTTDSGLAITSWYPRGLPGARRDLAFAAEAVDWIEAKLGPYPFSTLGQVMTDSDSAMETQTMVTLGNNEYIRSPAVILHELVHQWWGDQVSPADWRDVWLNEGFTMYLQWVWEAEQSGENLERMLAQYAASDQWLRDAYGPPGDWRPEAFGAGNIYYLPALMWHELRLKLGDGEFWRIVGDWPREQDNASVTRDQLYDYIEAESGLELSEFFDAWIMGEKTPPRAGRSTSSES